MGSEQFEIGRWPFFWMTQAAGEYQRLLETGLKRVGLDVPRWRVLMCVEPGKAPAISEVAQLAIVKMPTMVRILQRMVESGLVSTTPRASDGRVTEVRLTPEGLAARERAWDIAERIYRRAFTGLSPQEEATLNRLLARIQSNLRD